MSLSEKHRRWIRQRADDYRTLLATLDYVAEHGEPSAADLADAPILERWALWPSPDENLTGWIGGDSPADWVNVTTIFVDPEHEWILAEPGLCRLGAPAEKGKEYP